MQRPPDSIVRRDPREGALARTLGIPDLMARVLLARGMDDPEKARQHLRPELDTLSDPFRFVHMERAVARIRDAVARREPILIHGDYDVDGVSGTVLLLHFFALLDAEVKAHIPERKDGYSFSAASLAAVQQTGSRLCISVDNGTNAGEWIRRIQEAGCDVIVTDHHGTSEDVAPAHTMLNPRLPGAGYPDTDLAGVGVAFRLVTALAQSFSRGRLLSTEFRDFLLDAVGYVALGTVADMAPLRGENRVLVHHGLRALAVSSNPGIRALLDAANLGSHRTPDAEDVAFRLAPLINAAGRMGNARDAVRLLTARSYAEAQELARQLETHNQERRRVERQLVEVALAEARGNDDPILVLAGDGWHPGVLGIVAARVLDLLGRPTILISFDGEQGRGSGRACAGFDLRAALGQCASSLRAYGGHAAAVGLEIERGRLDEFRRRLNQTTSHDAARTPAPGAEVEAGFAELDPRAVRKLDALGPFGVGNRRPLFVARDTRLVGSPQVDGRNQDLRFRLTQSGILLPARLRAGSLRFEELRRADGALDVVFSPRLAQWAEEGPVELVVQAVHTHGNGAIVPGPGAKRP